METGYIHVYTGNGKGKSTAAFGLALRALCAGRNVYIGQFVKSMQYNETKVARFFTGEDGQFGRLTVEQLGSGCFIRREPEQKDIDMAVKGLERCRARMESGEYGVVILDELNIALHFNLLTMEAVEECLKHRHPSTEVVITGRYAPDRLVELADLVTEMKEVKHYYTRGVLSRNGIDR